MGLQAEQNYYQDILQNHKDYKTYKNIFTKLKKTGLHIITLKNLISVANNGMIDYYENNRGFSGLTENHITRLVDEFDYNSLGILSMVYNKKKKRLKTVDGSHRMGALCRLAVEGKLEKYWDEEIVIKVVDEKEFFTTYQNINSGIAHTKGNTLSNKDLAYGKLISYVTRHAEEASKLEIEFPRRNYKVLSFILYSLLDNKDDIAAWIEDWSYENVWANYRKEAAQDLKQPKPMLSKLKTDDCFELVSGVIIALKYLHELELRKKQFEANLIKDIPDQHARRRATKDMYPHVLYCDTIIGYLICAGSRKIHKLEDAKVAVTAITKRGTKLANMINRGHARTVDKFTISLYLDRAIFGNDVKAADLNYVVNTK